MDEGIEVHDLGHRFGTRWAIRHISFNVQPGEAVGMLGPNGAGKTTTVRILTGLLRPTEGAARVEGLDVVADAARLGQRIGVSFERPNLYERLTVTENLTFFARLLGLDRQRVHTLLDEARLLKHAHDLVANLSKGMRQRVILARALLAEPQVLFLDEPTAGLDAEAARNLRTWIRHLLRQGRTVLLTTHDMDEAAQLCGRVAIVHQGSLIAFDTPNALIERLAPSRLRVRVRRNGLEEDIVLPSVAADAARALAAVQTEAEILQIHEESASLSDVYLSMTGCSLTDTSENPT